MLAVEGLEFVCGQHRVEPHPVQIMRLLLLAEIVQFRSVGVRQRHGETALGRM